MLEHMKKFFEESRHELKRVNWPTRRQTIRYTLFVIGLSLGFSAFLGILDFGFLQGLKTILPIF